jgi:multidrug efflux pump subunit AcrA (membrane-fusion protein)
VLDTTTVRQVATRLRPRTRRQYLALAVVVLVVGGSGYWFLGRADSAEDNPIVATVTPGTYQQTVSASGTIASAKEADLDFDVSGRVTAVKVTAGDTVAKGDVLAKLDTTSLDAALASAKAQLTAAETTAANDGGDSSTQQAANLAGLASAKADVAQAEDDLDAATLKATFSGTVASVDVAVGDQVGSAASSGLGSDGSSGGSGDDSSSGSGSDSGSTAAVTVIKPTRFVVDVDVAADDITDVKKGLQAKITPAGATEPIYGTVQDVGRVAETGSSGAATFPVTVTVTGTQKKMYAGTSADVSIIAKQVEDVLAVPSLALTTSGGKTYVTKIDGSKTTKTAVTVGETYGLSTEITKGLKSGDKVQVATGNLTRAGRSPSGSNQQKPGVVFQDGGPRQGGNGGFTIGGGK